MKLRCLVSLAAAAALLLPAGSASAQDAKRPNVLLIFADDAGYRDFGFMGSPQYRTPHLDRLAERGVVFTNGYVSSSVCGPSRAGLMSGRYQQRFGYFMNPGKGDGLPTDQATLGKALQDRGYRTGIIGKWHLGESDRFHPSSRGFDYFYGFLAGHRSYFPWDADEEKGQQRRFRLMHNRALVDEYGMEFYTTDLFTDKAIEFMQESEQEGKPFFLYLSHNAVHGPMEALESDMSPYTGLDDPQRVKLGGMTAALDRSTGRLMEYLNQTGLRENTLVVFLNDNGGGAYIAANNHPLRGHKGSEWEGGNRVPFVMSWPGQLPEGERYDQPVISLDLYPTFLRLAGGDPEARAQPLDGEDLLPYLRGEREGAPHEALFWQRNNAAVRAGDWKLLHFVTRDGAFHLYNLADDVGEQNNLINQRPDIAEDLKARLKAWQDQHAPRR